MPSSHRHAALPGNRRARTATAVLGALALVGIAAGLGAIALDAQQPASFAATEAATATETATETDDATSAPTTGGDSGIGDASRATTSASSSPAAPSTTAPAETTPAPAETAEPEPVGEPAAAPAAPAEDDETESAPAPRRTSEAPAPAPPAAAAAPAGGRQIQAYLTGYSYFDNTPAGSPRISHPKVHRTAGGSGTYDDPITVAVGHSKAGGGDTLDWAAGTRFYVPSIKRYLIVEDTCGDGDSPQDGACHTGFPSSASTWLDVWVDGRDGSSSSADTCMGRLTGVHPVVVDPGPGLPVIAGPIASGGGCAF
ncbi:hypothetical protein ACI79D_14780 [Geodermatophilus sp. SYSU D00708]